MKYIILTILLLFTLTGCSYSEQQNTGNYNAEKTSSENNTSPKEYQEQELASFTTTIYTKTDARQNNVKLACQELSGTIVEPRGDLFFLRYFRTSPT